MELSFFQISFLAILQGITEFLPISSSGHLLLPGELWGWPDQGLVFDVAVHIGSLLAVVYYFRQALQTLISAWFVSLRGKGHSESSRLAWLLLMATVPAGLSGLLLNDWVESYARSMVVIGCTSILFGALLWWADRSGRRLLGLHQLGWRSALLIGMAQVLALIPGTSRSGITMTAALAVNLSREAAARFSFLLAIPIIAASGLLKTVELVQLGASPDQWITLLYGVLLSALVSFACIHYFLRLIERIGFLPFVLYRMVLGVMLLVLHFV
ncbi:MAG: hypothetical protein RLZZ385_1349 [Pseudomonadota bacterium]|jgi:undecaprenyl-diphosphatase